jgi:O-antigen/teichoic acid export membrane protein
VTAGVRERADGVARRSVARPWPVVRSAVLMGGGTLLVGAGGYAFIALAGNTLPPAETAAVSSFYMLVNILGPGVFMALEQETNRLTSGAGDRPVRGDVVRGTGLLLTVLVVLALTSPWLVRGSLLGHWELFAALVVSAVTAAAVYFVRGVLAGRGAFAGYSATLAAEGLMRLVPALGIAAVGLAAVGAYGLSFALGSGFGAIAGLFWIRRARARPVRESTAPERGAVGGLAPLVGATLTAQLVANLAPVVVTGRLAGDAATAAAFSAAFVLVRVPLFVFSPVQAVVVPAVATAAAARDGRKVRRIVRTGGLAALVLGLLGAAGMAAFGPWAVRTLLGAKVAVPGAVLGLLGLGTALLILAQVLQAALVALRAHVAATGWWQASAVVLVVFLALPVAPVGAAVAGQVTASAVVVLGMLAALRSRLRRGSNASESPGRSGA